MSGDNYLWAGPLSGSWAAAENWDDTTTGMNPAAVAPGVNDAVTINGAADGTIQVITGTGTSASLTILGATNLAGQFTTGALNFQVSDFSQLLSVGGGESLAVGGDVTSDGVIEVIGGSLTAGGAVSVGSLQVSNSGSVQIGGSITGGIQVDSSSTAEIGSSHSATAGEIVIDAGATASDAGFSFFASEIINNGTASATLSADTVVNNGILSGDIISPDGTGTLTNNGTISGFGQLNIPTIVNSGTIAVTDQATVVGSITGTGQITIGDGLTLQVIGEIASGNTITFLGGNSNLVISGSVEAPIVGFGSSDVIDFSDYGYVTSASYANGTLTLYEGATSVATLHLVGNYAGASFIAVPVTDQGAAVTQISLVTGGDTGAPPAGTSSNDNYLWAGPLAGSWDVAGNWDDTTTGMNPAAVAPGVNDAVTINGAAAGTIQVITGTGTSASLTILGATNLAGQFTTGALNFQVSDFSQPLSVGGGDSLAVSGDVTSDGMIEVIGGSFTAGGVVSIGALDVSNSGSVQIGGSVTGGIQVDTSSTAEIGSSHSATAGEIVIDAGATASDASFSASDIINNGAVSGVGLSASDSIVNNGTISDGILSADIIVNNGTMSLNGGYIQGSVLGATGMLTNNGTISGFAELNIPTIVNSGTIAVTDPDQTTLVGSITGTGQITIGDGLTLQVIGEIASGNTITFLGGNSSLVISGSVDAPIVGFGSSDAIDFSDYSYVTSASYANGTLTLYEGATSVATLRLVGNYANTKFIVAPVASQSAYPDAAQITLSPVAGNAAPVLTVPTSISATYGGATAVAGIGVTDTDAVSANETLIVVLTDQAGLLSANTGAAGGGGAIAGSGTTNLTIFGNLAQVNADLSTVALLSNTAGSDSINVSVNDGRGGVSNVHIAVSITASPFQLPPDIFSNGTSDILWHNTNGDTALWYMGSGFSPVDLGVVDTSWVPVATGDFNTDKNTDILWRNSNGEVGEWMSNGNAGFTKLDLGNVDPSWSIRGLGDFNGDGASDILWRNSNGEIGEWLSNGAGGGFNELDLGNVDPSWNVQGIGDFDGGGKADILWRNVNGEVGLWLSNGGTGPNGFTKLDLGNVSADWVSQDVGDFNGDGKADILWRNANGEVGLWLSNGGAGPTGFNKLDLGNVSTSWVTQGIGDFNGDGRVDILWRNANGEVGVWLSNGGTGPDGFTKLDLGNVSADWVIEAVHDYNGDGRADILWRDTNGDVGEWLSNGAGSFNKIVLTNAPTSWSPVGAPPATVANMASAMAAMGAHSASAAVASIPQAAVGNSALIAAPGHGL